MGKIYVDLGKLCILKDFGGWVLAQAAGGGSSASQPSGGELVEGQATGASSWL